MISTLKEIGFWRRLFQWKAVCSEIGAEFASIKADLDTANLQLHAYEQRLSASKTANRSCSTPAQPRSLS